MKKTSPILAFGIAIALFAGSASAENLLDAYKAAAQSDPKILEAAARKMAALEVKPQARGALFPQLNGSGQYASSDSNGKNTYLSKDPITGEPEINYNNVEATSDYWQYQFELTQTVFNWNQWQTLQRADAEVALAEARYRAAEQDLLVRVASRYFDVLAAEDTLAAALATLQAVTRQLEQAEKRFEVGLIAITDVQEARAAHDNATAGVILAKRSLATAHEFLREITGEDYTTLVKPADDMPLNQPDPGDRQSWVSKAEAQNLDVIAARFDVDIAKRNVKIAESGHMPTIELFGTYAENDAATTQTNNGVKGPADSSGDQTVYGVQMTLPVFSGGVVSSQVRERVYLHRAAREKLEGSIRAAQRSSSDAFFGVVAEKARVVALKQAVASNKTALEATEAGFEVGTRTTVDVLDARRRLFEAERDYARSRYDYLINVVNLKSSAGVLAPGDLASINDFLTTPTELQLPEVARPGG